jgi:hypothetical protein
VSDSLISKQLYSDPVSSSDRREDNSMNEDQPYFFKINFVPSSGVCIVDMVETATAPAMTPSGKVEDCHEVKQSWSVKPCAKRLNGSAEPCRCGRKLPR